MKIPEIFLPDKTLENKIRDLTRGPKSLRHEKPVSCSVYDTVSKAEKIAQKLGRFRIESFVFKDKKTNLIIEYIAPSWPGSPESERLKIYLKKGLFKREKVLEFYKDDKEPVSTYSPGEWEEDLEKLYTISQQK